MFIVIRFVFQCLGFTCGGAEQPFTLNTTVTYFRTPLATSKTGTTTTSGIKVIKETALEAGTMLAIMENIS